MDRTQRIFTFPPIHPLMRHPWQRVALAARGIVAALALTGPYTVRAQDAPAPLPSFAELESAGAKVGEIRIVTHNIFDADDPKENNMLFRWANALHARTKPEVIERALLFKTGDRVSTRMIDETERVLRRERYLYDVHLRPVAMHDGVVDIEVATRDTWTIELDVNLARTGGANSSGFQIKDYNLLGSGISVGYSRSNTVDRSSNEFEISNDRAFGGWTSIGYSQAQNSDGKRQAASIMRPFYALDTRWSAGASVSKDDRIDSVYNAGNVVSQYRHSQDLAEIVGGWSQGRVDGWVRRYSLGVNLRDDAYAAEPGLAAPAQLSPNERLVTPFVRLELIEDRFQKLQNHNQVGRPEYFAMGFASTLQLGRATTGLGSTRDAWVYSGTVSRGIEPLPRQTLLASAAFSGQYADGQVRRQRLGGAAQYFLPQSKHWLFYTSVSGDLLKNPDPLDELLLGGDNGLRGYPLRYQSGNRRVLLTVEERVYTHLYLLRLFRVGGAGFFDAGRAWAGSNTNTANPGWLSNAGFGLRFFSVRAATSTVLHVDVAFPLNTADVNVKKTQFLIKTKTSF